MRHLVELMWLERRKKARRTRKRSSFMEGFDKEKRSMKNVSYFKRHTRKVTKTKGFKGKPKEY